MERTLRDALRAAARMAVAAQRRDGSFAAGHNGPYHDPETPVRNTAHWLVTLCDLYRESGDEVWSAAAHRAVDYLLGESARPAGASFFCRSKAGKDSCNGLMGQAWAMEGLIAAARVLERENAMRAAGEVFFLHPFLEDRAVWERVDVDGTPLPPDNTFNHQLWFAAVGAMLHDPEADRRSSLFLDRVGTRAETYGTGVVYHNASITGARISRPVGAASLRRDARALGSRWRSRRTIRCKSIGYHAFNLYAYALLEQRFPAHPFWASPIMKKMLHVTTTPAFKRELEDNPYGYPYNPAGLELAFVGEVFGLGRSYAEDWVGAQVAATGDPVSGSMMTRGVQDAATSSARIYEAARLREDYEVSLGA